MASDESAVPVFLGDVIACDGSAVTVLAAPNGAVGVLCTGNFFLEPESRDELRELLDRAAMPGQRAPSS